MLSNLTKIIVLVAILVILFILYSSIQTSIEKQSPPDDFGRVIPQSSSQKPMCTYTRTSCDPSIPSDCANKCLDTNSNQFKCVNLNDKQPSNTNSNGGGYVCLPSEPTNECDTSKGGANIWTGYGMANQQGWSCLCTQPLVYGGEGCKYRNPSYCSGGTINPSDLSCMCPDGTEKRWRTNVNTPFCVSKSSDFGGYMGLAGNQLNVPNWGNVRYNLAPNDNYADWASRIAREMNLFNVSGVIDKIKTIISSKQTSNNIIYELNDDIINGICNDSTINSKRSGVQNALKMCSTDDSAGKNSYKNAFDYATYTYVDNTYKNVG